LGGGSATGDAYEAAMKLAPKHVAVGFQAYFQAQRDHEIAKAQQ
jgi:hypothetical protein